MRDSGMQAKQGDSLLDLPVLALCHGCGEIGWLRHVGCKCWMCGGWVGHEYDFPSEVHQMARGWGFGFYGGTS